MTEARLVELGVTALQLLAVALAVLIGLQVSPIAGVAALAVMLLGLTSAIYRAGV